MSKMFMLGIPCRQGSNTELGGLLTQVYFQLSIFMFEKWRCVNDNAPIWSLGVSKDVREILFD